MGPPEGGYIMSSVLVPKRVIWQIEEEAMSLLVLYNNIVFVLFCQSSSFNPSLSFCLFLCFKATTLVGKLLSLTDTTIFPQLFIRWLTPGYCFCATLNHSCSLLMKTKKAKTAVYGFLDSRSLLLLQSCWIKCNVSYQPIHTTISYVLKA